MNQQFDNMNTDHDLHAESNTSLQIIHDAQPTLRESIPKAFLNCPATSTRPRHMNLTNHPHSNFQLISITLLIRTEIHSSSKHWRPRSRLDSREPLCQSSIPQGASNHWRQRSKLDSQHPANARSLLDQHYLRLPAILKQDPQHCCL